MQDKFYLYTISAYTGQIKTFDDLALAFGIDLNKTKSEIKQSENRISIYTGTFGWRNRRY